MNDDFLKGVPINNDNVKATYLWLYSNLLGDALVNMKFISLGSEDLGALLHTILVMSTYINILEDVYKLDPKLIKKLKTKVNKVFLKVLDILEKGKDGS